jgi:2-haloacid dehalogenase
VKPDAAIYRILLNRNNLAAAQCVFIDDSMKNVLGARDAGMHGLHFTTPDKLSMDLEALGFPV